MILTEKQEIHKQLMWYFGWTFLITWILWSPSILKARGFEVPDIFLIISLMASFTPSLVGLWMAKKASPTEGYRQILARMCHVQFRKLWFLILSVLFIGAAAASYYLTFQLDPNFQPAALMPVYIMPLVFIQILFIGGALGEEFGWRGFALPLLQNLYTPWLSTLILGVLWSLWHLPLFFMVGTVQSSLPLWQFMLQNTLMAYFYTHVYNQTKGSMILMIFLHAIANTASAIFPFWQSEIGRYTLFAILVVALLGMKRIRLNQPQS